jgi:hypothetical protein
MTEIPHAIKNVVDDFQKQINKIYSEKMQEHVENISYKLNSRGYIENYGKITHIHKQLRCSNKKSKNNSIPEPDIKVPEMENGYFIHICCEQNYTGNERGTVSNYFMIDNYGIAYIIHQKKHPTKPQFQTSEFDKFENCSVSHLKNNNDIKNYPLPNILIDFIKNTPCIHYINNCNDGSQFINFLNNIHMLSRNYYENFTKYRTLYESGKLEEYDDLMQKTSGEKNEQIIELKKIIADQKTAHDELLFSHEQLQNKCDKNDKKIIELMKANDELQQKNATFKDLLTTKLSNNIKYI